MLTPKAPFGAVIALLALCLACSKDLGVTGIKWACQTDSDCTKGFVCRDSGALGKVCLDPSKLPEDAVEPVDVAADIADAPDVQVPDADEGVGPPDVSPLDAEPGLDQADPAEDIPSSEDEGIQAEDASPSDEAPDDVAGDSVVDHPAPDQADEAAVDQGAEDVPVEDPTQPDEGAPEPMDVPPDEVAAEVCVPACTGLECGTDGCGGSCGTCGEGFQCVEGRCNCVPACSLLNECGSDGCGASCGQCGEGCSCVGDLCWCFVDNGDGTVTDPKRGLMWLQGKTDGSPEAYAEAETECAGLSLAGKDDWRLPDVDELRSLVAGCKDTALGGGCGVVSSCPAGDGKCWTAECIGCDPDAGPGDFLCYALSPLTFNCARYWSSTSSGDGHYVVDFKNASVSSYTGGIASVRCVRSLP